MRETGEGCFTGRRKLFVYSDSCTIYICESKNEEGRQMRILKIFEFIWFQEAPLELLFSTAEIIETDRRYLLAEGSRMLVLVYTLF